MAHSAKSKLLSLLQTVATDPEAPKTTLEELFCQAIATGGLTSLPGSTAGTVDELRIPIWRRLLDIPADLDEDALSAEVASVDMDLANQRVIRVDAERTRGDIPGFATPEMNQRIQRLLTYYCKKGYACQWPRKGQAASSSSPSPLPQVAYKQGLNEILAVFLSLGHDKDVGTLSDGLVMALWSRFVSYFAPRIYASQDVEFTSLQCSLRLLRLLLQYHCPGISQLLDQYGCEPELYSTPWILCLMARGNSIRHCVLPLWDFLVCCCAGDGRHQHPGPNIFHCVLLSFLSSLHPRLIETAKDPATVSELPMVLARATLFGREHVDQIASTALDYYAETPLSFRRLIAALVYGGLPQRGTELEVGSASDSSLPLSAALLARLDQRLVVKISIPELLLGAGSRFYDAKKKQKNKGDDDEEGEQSRGKGGKSGRRQHHRRHEGRHGHEISAGAGGLGKEPKGFERLLVCRTKDSKRGDSAPPSPSSSSSSAFPSTSSTIIPIERVAPRYFLVDVRPLEEFEAGHMPTAFHLDPALLERPEDLKAAMEGFSGLKGVHFAIMGSGNVRTWYHTPVLTDDMRREKRRQRQLMVEEDRKGKPGSSPAGARAAAAAAGAGGAQGKLPHMPTQDAAAKSTNEVASDNDDESDDDDDAGDIDMINPLSSHEEEDDYADGGVDWTRAFVLMFLQRGFLRVSEVEGGYAALHQHQANFLNTVLVNHDPSRCAVCSPPGAANAAARGNGDEDDQETDGGRRSRTSSSTSSLRRGSPPSASPSASVHHIAHEQRKSAASTSAPAKVRRGDYSALSSSSLHSVSARSSPDDHDEEDDEDEEEEVEVTLFEQDGEKEKEKKAKPKQPAVIASPRGSASAKVNAKATGTGSLASSSKRASASLVVATGAAARVPLHPLHRADLVDEEVGLVGLDSFTQQQRQRKTPSSSSSSTSSSGVPLTSAAYDPDYEAFFAAASSSAAYWDDFAYHPSDGRDYGYGEYYPVGVPVLKEWVYLEQQTDDLERANEQAASKQQQPQQQQHHSKDALFMGLRVAKSLSVPARPPLRKPVTKNTAPVASSRAPTKGSLPRSHLHPHRGSLDTTSTHSADQAFADAALSAYRKATANGSGSGTGTAPAQSWAAAGKGMRV